MAQLNLDPQRLPWWFDPLVWWLAEVEAELDPLEAIQLQTMITKRRREIIDLVTQLVARNRKTGKFLWPVEPIADTLRPSPIVEGSLSALPPGSRWQRIVAGRLFVMKTPFAQNPTPLDALALEERRQVIAVGNLIFTAWFAARQPTRIEVGGPPNLDHPSDVVGVERVRGVKGAAVGLHLGPDHRRRNAVERDRFLHAKGVAGKVLGATISLYGKPRPKAARSLTQIVIGVDLTVDQVKALL